MKMNLPASMRIGQVKADIGTHAVTAALPRATSAPPSRITTASGVPSGAPCTAASTRTRAGESESTVTVSPSGSMRRAAGDFQSTTGRYSPAPEYQRLLG